MFIRTLTVNTLLFTAKHRRKYGYSLNKTRRYHTVSRKEVWNKEASVYSGLLGNSRFIGFYPP